MAPRKTRQKIRDHVSKAVGHLENAILQLGQSMELGEERSPICFHLIPKVIEMLIEQKDMIEKIRSEL